MTVQRLVERLHINSGCKEGARGGTRGSPALKQIQRLVIARQMLKENRAFLLAGVA